MTAPIVLFVYNREAIAKLTIDALLQNNLCKDSDLIIYSDGPKNTKDIPEVHKVRQLIKTISGFNSVTIKHQENNLGLAKSIISGVTEVLEHYEKVIVLEDDLIVSKYFLEFMNEALNKYYDDNRVVSIHGYMYPLSINPPETFFLRGADCWGWATWRRAWKLFNPDASSLLSEIVKSNLSYQFNYNDTFSYTKMLQDQINGKIDSWAVRWHASAFIQNKLTLFPGVSLVNNVGTNTSATHTKSLDGFQTRVSNRPIRINNINVEESSEIRKELIKYFGKIKKAKLIKGLLNRLIPWRDGN